jgi:chromosome segregation ATPase
MEEKNEILEAMKEGFERIDERLGRIEGDVSVLKTDVSVLKTDVSVLKTDVSVLKTDMGRLKKETRKAHIKLEFLIDKADLIKENVVDMRSHIGRYDTEVEHPLEQRVTHR